MSYCPPNLGDFFGCRESVPLGQSMIPCFFTGAIEWTHKRKNSHYISMIR
ncbi:hypothetical protein D1AOALGA4SA_1442 [Olavius algarvensis Delta 1 endosymbiont]|nr:hypothetical protein D1AOALGA4SA_1442 [Olavius algarvensis Delta 1 endosymbiont]